MTRRQDKRNDILTAACSLFRSQGFAKTSISDITARVGSSKATIYNHFRSKEELFVECMTAAVEDYITSTVELLNVPGTDPLITLRVFGASFLSFASSPHTLAMKRLLIAEAGRSGIGKLYCAKIAALRERVALLLSQFMASGGLRSEDAGIAADHLRALLEAEVVEPLLLRAHGAVVGERAVASAAHRAVAAFLQAYAPDD